MLSLHSVASNLLSPDKAVVVLADEREGAARKQPPSRGFGPPSSYASEHSGLHLHRLGRGDKPKQKFSLFFHMSVHIFG